MILMLFCMIAYGFDTPVPSQCVIDRCEGNVCVVETPEGIVEIPKKPHYKEGVEVICPLWMIDPT